MDQLLGVVEQEHIIQEFQVLMVDRQVVLEVVVDILQELLVDLVLLVELLELVEMEEMLQDMREMDQEHLAVEEERVVQVEHLLVLVDQVSQIVFWGQIIIGAAAAAVLDLMRRPGLVE
jgi:hypothetical protein